MLLPNAENANFDLIKLTEYCLSKEHPIGKHKAIVFEAKLGVSAEDAQEFRKFILKGILNNEANFNFEDEFGKRYFVDIKYKTKETEWCIRTSWIIKSNELNPRFVSCYIKK
jgi:hypothetical protein